MTGTTRSEEEVKKSEEEEFFYKQPKLGYLQGKMKNTGRHIKLVPLPLAKSVFLKLRIK